MSKLMSRRISAPIPYRRPTFSNRTKKSSLAYRPTPSRIAYEPRETQFARRITFL